MQTVTEKDRQTECKKCKQLQRKTDRQNVKSANSYRERQNVKKRQQIPETTPVSVRRNEGGMQRPCRQELRKEITERDWFIFEFQRLVNRMMSPQEETEMEKTTNRHTARQTTKRNSRQTCRHIRQYIIIQSYTGRIRKENDLCYVQFARDHCTFAITMSPVKLFGVRS